MERELDKPLHDMGYPCPTDRERELVKAASREHPERQSTNIIGQYEEIGAAVGRLVDKKHKAYGRSFDMVADILRMMFPRGIRPDQYDDLNGIIRNLDKLFRIANQKESFEENPWQDIAGYGLLKCGKSE